MVADLLDPDQGGELAQRRDGQALNVALPADGGGGEHVAGHMIQCARPVGLPPGRMPGLFKSARRVRPYVSAMSDTATAYAHSRRGS